MPNSHRFCVIMCGGVGSRFWPYSRNDNPKQFLDFLGTGRTLLQMSYDRILPLVPRENIIILTNARYAAKIKEQLPELTDDRILLEPTRRNTAPCLAWAAYHIRALDPEASIVVTPSDHLITRERDFEQSILQGFEFVESHDALLTLGIQPTRPDTSYGYIQAGPEVCGDIHKVKTFTEKPDLELAKTFLKTGEFFWNSGIFLWRVDTIIRALAECAPDIASVFERGSDVYGTPAEQSFIEQSFPGCMGISIDYAVMERASNVYVETVTFGWSNLGSWNSLYDMSPKNRDGNVTQTCRVLSYDSTGNIIAVKDDKLVVVEGLHDFIVADAGDVLLICPKADEQRIREVVNDIKLNFGEKYL